MSIRSIQVSGYRSIERLSLPLSHLNVIVGPNGCGKSNLYQSMVLLSEAANGRFAQALAREGGMPSVVWAGQRKKRGPIRMTLSVTLDEYSYELSCGLPQPSDSAFRLDPEIKEERVWIQDARSRKVEFLNRKGPAATVRDQDGRRVQYPLVVSPSESALSQISEPHHYPELAALRVEMNSWRFYHHFPIDASAPARGPTIGVRTPVLNTDGSDLAAALQTILEIGDASAVHEAIDRAIPGAGLILDTDHQSRMVVQLVLPGLNRNMDARELSDGTLRYLYLVAALLSPRPPSLIALNEPESSLHPDVIEALAHLIWKASRNSQMWIVTHSELLAKKITEYTGIAPIALQLHEGETRVERSPSIL